MSATVDQQALANALRARADRLPDEFGEDIRELSTLIETEAHPGELARWLVNAAEVDYSVGQDNGAPRRASTVTDFTKVVARPIRWAWQNRIALGKLTALSGRPKIGKGLLFTDTIARVTRGELDGDLKGQPKDVFIVTTEDEPGDVLKPRLMAAGADLTRVFFFQMGARMSRCPSGFPSTSRSSPHGSRRRTLAWSSSTR